MIGGMDEATRKRIYNTPGVAMCDGKIFQRWERGGDSHWIVGTVRTVDGVRYKLVHIQVTDNLIYHMCEKAY